MASERVIPGLDPAEHRESGLTSRAESGSVDELSPERGEEALAECVAVAVSEVLERILGFTRSVNSPERSNAKLVVPVPAYWVARPPAPEAQKEEIVVATVDCKGAKMRKASAQTDVRREPIEVCKTTMCAEQAPGAEQKKARKKMAVVGSAYTIAPYDRTPDQVLDALFRYEQEPRSHSPLRPKPLCRFIRTNLRRDEFDTLKPAYEGFSGWLAKQHRQRNPQRRSPNVLLMDGQISLWKVGDEYHADAQVIEMLDLQHATSYIWKPAAVFHPGVKAQGLMSRILFCFIVPNGK